MNLQHIKQLTGAGHWAELTRLLRNGGSVRVDEKGEVLLFTTATQHVTAPSLDLVVAMALVREEYRANTSTMERTGRNWEEWCAANQIPKELI